MKIWFAVAIPSESHGGVARSVRELSCHLNQNGHKTRIIYSRHSITSNYLMFSFTIAVRLMFNFLSPPDWIIARSTDGVFAAMVIRLFRMRVKIALHNHGWEEKVYELEASLPKRTISNPTTLKAHLLRFPLLRLSAILSDVCISGTLDETRWLKKKSFTKKCSLITIPNGIDTPVTPFWPHQPELPPYFLTVGAFTWKKNLEYALLLFTEIFNITPSARLFCVGTDSTQDSIRIDSNAVHAITFINKESPERMYRWYEECPYLLSTSRYEGGRPFTLLEAQSRGMIVCSVAISSSKELITHKKSGILLDGICAEKDAATITAIMEDTSAVKNIGISAWKKACRNRWERQIQRLERVLKS